MKCDYDNLTSYILDQRYFNTTWTVFGLIEQVDFANKNGQLFIKPYALTKLDPESNSVLISVNISSLLSNQKRILRRRILQDIPIPEPSPADGSNDAPVDGGTTDGNVDPGTDNSQDG